MVWKRFLVSLLVVEDVLGGDHRSKITQPFIRDQNGRLKAEYLPPYAPELNPVEYIRAHCEHHELPNV